MKRRITGLAFALVLCAGLLAGCARTKAEALNPKDYPDPPLAQRQEALPVYMAWDSAQGETWAYEFSAAGLIEEGSRPAPEAAEEGEILLEPDDPPGGRVLWFRGVSPGDVVVTFTTKSSGGQVVDIQQYAIRVYEDMRLALLQSDLRSFRQ